jgi:membrane-associated protease RseP (regulator of RpoE activity)
MSVREILWPTRWKLATAFLIAAVSVLLIYVLNPYYRDALFGLEFSLRVLSVFASFLIVTAIYYPFSCGLVFLLKEFWGKPAKATGKKAKSRKRDIIIAVLLILVFNPLMFSLIYSLAIYVNNNVINYPCGVAVLGFSSNSSAEAAGMQPGELIIKVDNFTIDTTDSLTRALAGKSPGEAVDVTTGSTEYQITLGENPQTHRAVLGVITQNAYCQR